MGVRALDYQMYAIKLYIGKQEKYLFNQRTALHSREMARPFSSRKAAVHYLSNSDFSGFSYEILIK